MQEKIFDAARRAVALDETDAEARSMLARAYNMSGDRQNGLAENRRALELNPQNVSALMVQGVLYAFHGQPDEGIPWLERVLEISPLDPRNFVIKTHLAVANICAGHYEKAADLSRDATRQHADYIDAHLALASSLGHLGLADEAVQALGEFRERAVEYVETYPIWDRGTKDRILAGLRKAKLIE